MKHFLIPILTSFVFAQLLFAENLRNELFDDLNKSQITSKKANVVNNQISRLKHVLRRSNQALLTYKSDSVVKEIYPNAKIHTTQTSKIKFISIVDSKAGTRLICVRGNSNFKNWLVSMDAELVKGFLGDIKIHSGFLKGALEVYESLAFKDIMRKKTTSTEQRNDLPLQNIILGHSMGGAIAVLLAKKMQMEGHNIKEVITFAQPMITNSEGASLMNSVPLLRVGLDRDVVIYLPAQELGYKHMGQKLEFDSYNFRFFEDSSRDNQPWSPPETREPLKEITEEQISNFKPYFGIKIKSSGLDEFVVAHNLSVYILQIKEHIRKLSKK
tara:strand:+ start:341 stop:1324 length:984 start_codon:yes stop_codon:yes gene_type:complete